MADEITPLPSPPHVLTTEELVHLTSALRTLTNGVLDLRSLVVTLVEKQAHLIAAEQTEGDDIREIRTKLDTIIGFLFQAAKDISATAVEVKTTREGVKRIEDSSGSFPTTTEEELRAEREVSTVKALAVIAERIKGLHPIVKYVSTMITGSGLYHLIQHYIITRGH